MILHFLHTAVSQISAFDSLLAEIAPDLEARHTVAADLLAEARREGHVTAAIQSRMRQLLTEARDEGAAVVVCTCSTLGGCTEEIAAELGVEAMRIDRPMAEAAVDAGIRLVVVAALQSTIEPTRALLEQVADARHKPVQILPVVCEEAWKQFEEGNFDDYISTIASFARRSSDLGDVIVLAQASMAPAVHLCRDLPVPILSSPSLGVAAAVSRLRKASPEPNRGLAKSC